MICKNYTLIVQIQDYESDSTIKAIKIHPGYNIFVILDFYHTRKEYFQSLDFDNILKIVTPHA